MIFVPFSFFTPFPDLIACATSMNVSLLQYIIHQDGNESRKLLKKKQTGYTYINAISLEEKRKRNVRQKMEVDLTRK